MKKKLFLAMMVIVAVFATLSFSACSSDDDNNNGSGNGKAQVTGYVAIAQDQLNLFDVYVTVNNGQKVQLTTSNTKLKVIQDSNFENQTVRAYDFSTTISSFPATYTVSAEAKVKDGVDIASQPASDYALSPAFETIVDATGRPRALSVGLSYTSNVNWKKRVESSAMHLYEKTVTKSISFDANGNYIDK